MTSNTRRSTSKVVKIKIEKRKTLMMILSATLRSKSLSIKRKIDKLVKTSLKVIKISKMREVTIEDVVDLI